MEHFFTIIGGMGTIATELYIRMINRKTHASRDQDYLNYILINYATIPDRSSYIMDKEHNDNPLPYLLDIIEKQNKLAPDFFTLTCNTAHYFYKDLVKATDKPILHMPQLAVDEVSHNYAAGARVGIIGTEGTIKNKIYDPFIEEAGFEVVHPTKEIQEMVSYLIFTKVKEQNEMDTVLYDQILDKMLHQLGCDVVMLGCTELSLLEDAEGFKNKKVVDPQNILAEKTVELALSYREKDLK